MPRSADDGFRLDGPRLLTALGDDERIRLVCLTSPNNPTGDTVDETLLLELLEQTRDRAVVVMDEACGSDYSTACTRAEGKPRYHCGRSLCVQRPTG